MRPQDEIQHWRRVRKALASLLGDASREMLTWSDVKAKLVELHTLASEREAAWRDELSAVPEPDAPFVPTDLWVGLTAEQGVAARAAAPKTAQAWEIQERLSQRIPVGRDCFCAEVWRAADGTWNWRIFGTLGGPRTTVPTREDGMAAADAALLAEGWLLVGGTFKEA